MKKLRTDNLADEADVEELLSAKAKMRKNDALFYTALVLLVVAIVLTRIFVISNFTVIGTSMYPTLSDGDVVWVNKLATPKRGDLVVSYDEGSGKNLIKRVIAVDGDTIRAEKTSDGYRVVVTTASGEQLRENYSSVTVPNIIEGMLGLLSEEPFAVSGGCFLMGDNRNVSNDSRNPLRGVISYDDILGVVIDIKGQYR